MKIDTDTKLFFSVAGKPGNFGSYMYNSAFEKLGINAIYKPLQLDCKTNFDRFFDFLFALKRINASGLSVSMPFKKFAAILGFYKSEEVKNVQTEGKPEGLGGELYNKVQSPTDKLPDSNPLENQPNPFGKTNINPLNGVQTNPFE